MKVSIEPWSEEIQARLEEVAPSDFPSPCYRSEYEAGKILFPVVRDTSGRYLGGAAVRLNDGPEFEVVGLNMEAAPFMLRTLFQSLTIQADMVGARLTCMVERDVMGKILERFGMEHRATLYVREGG